MAKFDDDGDLELDDDELLGDLELGELELEDSNDDIDGLLENIPGKLLGLDLVEDLDSCEGDLLVEGIIEFTNDLCDGDCDMLGCWTPAPDDALIPDALCAALTSPEGFAPNPLNTEPTSDDTLGSPLEEIAFSKFKPLL